MRISDWSSDVCSSDLRSLALLSLPPPLLRSGGSSASPSTKGRDRHDVRPESSGRTNRESCARRASRSPDRANLPIVGPRRSEENTSELQSLMRISYAVFGLKKKTIHKPHLEHIELSDK